MNYAKDYNFKQVIGDLGRSWEDIGVKTMTGSENYVRLNVRVRYMCSGSVLCMTALEILTW